jgi:hypothetical protein
MTPDTAPLRLELTADPSAGLDEDTLAAAQALDRELAESDLAAGIGPVPAGPAEAGAKSADAIALGALALAVLPATVPALVGFLKDWLLRNRGVRIKLQLQQGANAVELEYDPAAMSDADLDALIGRLKKTISGGRARKP